LTHAEATSSIILSRLTNHREEREMRLRLLGTSSGHAGCPALYATDRGTYVVQGKLITDDQAIDDLVDVREDEFYVEIPKALLRFAQDSE
jgi:hypothetical protein